ncbi:MAG TPA: MupA/Atu3671 family FMN-dependent luciferase-like monooxygenase, partial [Thermoanaerobaculia bacterium]|nr:MupA/Atu3671 family FMN-dependent luciferase-like monooxygenase [Thermoanaerobaculia bacterium]
VKTNLGHLDAGAGIAGLIKTVLALKHGMIPPSLHFREPNPEIEFAESPVYVNASLKPWDANGKPRRAGVSSFGIGGTNAHAILQEAPEFPSGPSREHQLLVWSAKSEAALDAATGNLAQSLGSVQAPALADAAFTLATGRRAFEHRRALVARDASEAAAALGSRDSQRLLPGDGPVSRRPVAFLLPGQGSQRAGAAREIYQSEKVFRAEVDRCAELLRPHLGADLRELLYPRAGAGEEAERRLEETAWSQPAVFVVGYALARLWMSWGVRPEALVGHSLGEYVAACLAGVIRLEDALALVALRGKLMQALPPGAMLAVPLSEAEVSTLLTGDLALAAINGPQRTVVSGPLPAIEELETKLAERGVEGRRLRTSHAFHSAMMEPMLPAFAERLRAIQFKASQIPYVSNVTGDWITEQQATDPAFWLRQLREPVRFGDAVGCLLESRDSALLEVGPGRTLTSLVKLHPALREAHRAVGSLVAASHSSSELAALYEALGRLWTSGVDIDWSGFYGDERRRRVSLPTYPFERQRYLIDRPAGAAAPWTELAVRQQEHVMNSEEPQVITDSPSPARLALIDLLKEMIRDLTGTEAERLDPQAAFLDIGVDSLLMVQAAQRLRDQLGVKLTVVQFLEELTTLEKVAEYVEREMDPERLAELTPRPPLPSPPLPPGEGAPPPSPHPQPLSRERERGEQPSAPAVQVPSPADSLPFTPLPLAGEGPGVRAQSTDVTQLLAQQLQVLQQVMSQQLQLLQGGAVVQPQPAAQTAPTIQPVAAPPPAQPTVWTQFANFHPIDKRPPEELTPQQKTYLDQFIRRYAARTAKSKQMTETYRPVLADGRGTVAFRRMWKEIVYPIHSQRSKGSRIWDVDGNEYVDITMGFGLHLFGHSPDFLVDALERQIRKGIEVGPQSPLAGQVAELLCEMTGMDRAMFCTSGTEAILGALRVARTVTGRNKVALLSDSFHGWSDTTMVRRAAGRLGAMPGAPGISAKALEEVVVLDYGSPETIAQLEDLGGEIAAVLVEPVRSRFPDQQPREFLQALRQVTKKTGTLLIFDEIVTGFRIHPGGAQAYFGVEADMATYGKLIAGGLPIGVIAGRTAVMDALDGGAWRFGDDSYPQAEKTLFTGTYFKHPLVLAATWAVLDRLRTLGPGLQEGLNARTAQLAADLNAWFQVSSVPIEAVHFGSLFRFRPARTMQLPELFYFHLVHHGLYFTLESGNCFLTTAHSEEDVERIQRAVRQSIEDLAAGGFLPEARPVPVAEREAERKPSGRSGIPRVLASNAVTGLSGKLPAPSIIPHRQGIDFSLYYFGPYEAGYDPAKYELLLQGARFADEHGFSGIWLPERHFHPFGGLSPNPSVLAAALARETKHLQLRAGSVVVPLHHPIRLAEDWSVVDNLSNGRVGVSFASGWHANDFVFAPYSYDSRYDVMYEGIEKVRSLWRGEPLRVRDGAGTELDVLLHPLPKQREIPVWLTGASPETFRKAGAMGAGVLTNLQGQQLDELAEKIELYHETLAKHGHDPASGRITVLLHTFLGDNVEAARAKAEGPLREYLRTSFDLSRKLVASQGRNVDFDATSQEDVDYLLDAAYERFVADHALVGTPESVAALIQKLIPLGVTEVGCLIDFGVEPSEVIASLPWLEKVRQRFERKPYTELPVTDNQRVLWIASKMSAGANRSYNEPLALHVRGPLNVPALTGAVQEVADRHQALRSSFSPDGTRQKISVPTPVQFPLIDYSGLPEPQRSQEVLWCLKARAGEIFDLENGPLLRVSLLRLGAEEHYLSLIAHHIVIDGGSAGVMVRELTRLYTARLRNEPNPLGPPGLLSDYVMRVVSRSPEAPDQIAAEAYWRQIFERQVNLLELPTDRPRPRSLPFWGDRRPYHIDADLMNGIRRLSARGQATPYATILATFGALLHDLTRQEDIIVGVPSRDPSVTGAMVGYFINLLPVRMYRHPDDTFTTFQAQVRKALLGVLEHQSFPLNRLLEKLGLAGGLDGFLIGTTFNMERLEEPQPMPGLDAEYSWVYHDAARIDLHINIMENTRHGGALLELAYRTAMYNAASVDRWARALLSVLRAIVADPEISLHALPLLAPEEQQQLISEWNDTRKDLPSALFVHELFERQAALRPTAPALALGAEELTYGEVDRLATTLAGYLVTLGVGPEVRVGLCLERSFEMIVVLLAILKAGAAYVPIEPGQPAERLLYLLEDAKAPLLLTRQWVIEKLGQGLKDLGIRAFDVDAGLPQGTAPLRSDAGLDPGLDPENLAYVIYTSGSTGKPNGVQVSHRSAVNSILELGAAFQIGPDDRFALVSSIGFDVSVMEIFQTFAAGACLCLTREEELANPVLLADRMARLGATMTFCTPSRLTVLPEAPLAKIRTMGVGGEACTAELVTRWSRGRRLVNCYGPTEAAIFAMVEIFEDQVQEKIPPIGRPLASFDIHVLDRAMKPVPIGVIGEIAIGGIGVARGYLDRAQKTAQKFVPDPFAAAKGEPGARLYLTGDLARYLRDGRIEFLGRDDGQMKLRGYRIELGEIETVIATCPGVKEAAVAVRGEGPNQMLVAYVVWEEGWPEREVAALRRRLQQQLPEYMVPAAWIELSGLPRTVNGKLDRLALRALQKDAEIIPHVDPETPLEKYLVDLWMEVLRLDKLSLHDNFLQVGGNSINAAMLAYRVQEVLEETLHAVLVFDAPTVADMARFLAERYPDRVIRIWGEESLPENLRGELLELAELIDEAGVEALELKLANER